MFDPNAPTMAADPSGSGEQATIAAVLASGDARSFPAAIGRYRILRLLGEGGMGAVYEAEQDQPRRLVALKVIKAAWASPEMLRRFEQESQALGRLHHPGIAQIYEAGSADAGFGVQPFFAMELIHGKPLVEYADGHKLNTRQRLELMIQVCDAVHHAHQRGIIHRDLKPGNILVDETGQPKILDFGLARATDSDAQATRQTDIGQLLGTLAYMSPEQVLADPLALDTRSDVYALGVILYELLAGKMPYTLSRQLHEAVRTIQETDPALLSTVSRVYRGDIETIVAKALEKDKVRRYASAAELAADIRRYLHDEPIVARPPSATYQLRKFARRHKALVAGVGAVFAALLLGIVASTWEAVQARRAEKKAQQESAVAQAVNDFLRNDLLGQASAFNQSKPDPNLTVRTALDRAAQKIGGKFKNQPEVEVAIRETIGFTYSDLGLYPQEQQQMQQAFDLSRRTLGMDDPRTLSILNGLATAEEDLGHYARSEELAEQALDGSRRVLGPENPATFVDTTQLLIALDAEGKYAEAEALGEQALNRSRKSLGPEDRNTSQLMGEVGRIYREEGKYAQAEALDQRTVDLRRRTLGAENPSTLDTMGELAWVYNQEGKYAQAEALDRLVLDVKRKVLGREHRDTFYSMNDLAADYQREGKYAQAETLYRQTLEIRRRVLGPEHPDTLMSMNNLGVDFEAERKYAQAEALDRQTVEISRRVLGPEHPDTQMAIGNLVDLYITEYKYTQAEDLWAHELEAAPDNFRLLNASAWLLLTVGDRHMRRPQEALELARRAVAFSPRSHSLLNTLGLAEVRNRLWQEAIDTLNKSVRADGGASATDFLFLAMAYQGHGEKAEAERNFARGADIATKTASDNTELRMLWGEAAEALGKPGPVPTLPEAKAEPGRAMERLKHMAAAGFLKPETLATSADLAPLRDRPDFQALVRQLRSPETPPAQ